MDTYEEKIRLAKEAIDSGSYDRETIEYIFPELKQESQDERIRQALLNYFNLYKNQETKGITTFFGVSTNDILTYLEKLKIFTEHGEGLYHFVNSNFTYIGDNQIVNSASCSMPKETACEACMREQPDASCSDVTALGRCALEHSKPVTKLL